MDYLESFGMDGLIGGGVFDIEGFDFFIEDIDCIVFVNLEMMEYVLLDWILWVIVLIGV